MPGLLVPPLTIHAPFKRQHSSRRKGYTASRVATQASTRPSPISIQEMVTARADMIYIYIHTCRLTILGLKTNAVYVGTFRLNFFAELLALARHAVRLARRARLPMRRA